MKKVLLTALLVYVVAFAFSFLFHFALLGDEYKAMSAIMRPQSERKALMPFMLLGQVFWSFGVAWLFSKGVQNAPWIGQGVRFGLGIAAVAVVPVAFGFYAMQPWPGMLMIKGTLADILTNVLIGVMLAYIYRAEAATSPRSHAGLRSVEFNR